MKKWTDKQLNFRKEYLIDKNATQAAIRAGYSEKTAYSIGQRLLKDVEMQQLIQSDMDAIAAKIDITAEKVLQEIAKLAFHNMADYVAVQSDGSAYVDLNDLTRDQMAALSEITVDEYMEGRGEDARPVKRVKIKLADKGVNLERLGKHLKLFNEVGSKDNPLVISDMNDLDAANRLAALVRAAKERKDGGA